jgi:hypothetical protein
MSENELEGRRVRIEMPQHGRGRVFVDDVEVKRVVSIKFEAMPLDVNRVTLTLIPEVVDITTVASVACEYKALAPAERRSDE